MIRFKKYAESLGLEVYSMINGRPDINEHLLDIFPMLEIDRHHLEPLVPYVDKAIKFTNNQGLLDFPLSFGERYNNCRFAFGKRLHGWLPFFAFDIPAAFIGAHVRRGFPKDYFGNNDFLCDVPRSNNMSEADLNKMTDMMIDKLIFFVGHEDYLSKGIAERREELWELAQTESKLFAEKILKK